MLESCPLMVPTTAAIRGETIYRNIDILQYLLATAIQYNMANREYQYITYYNILLYTIISVC